MDNKKNSGYFFISIVLFYLIFSFLLHEFYHISYFQLSLVTILLILLFYCLMKRPHLFALAKTAWASISHTLRKRSVQFFFAWSIALAIFAILYSLAKQGKIELPLSIFFMFIVLLLPIFATFDALYKNTIFIRIVAWFSFSVVLYFLIRGTLDFLFPIYTAVFLAFLFLFSVISITFGTSYSQILDFSDLPYIPTNYKKRCATFFRAYLTWESVYYLIAILSLYTASVVIYLSANHTSLNSVTNDLIIYSVLSLVTSVANYIIRPLQHAAGYRKAFDIMHKAITTEGQKYKDTSCTHNSSSLNTHLTKALNQAEDAIATRVLD